jgi:hypothetical protein
MTLVAGIDATPGASFGVGQGYAEHIMTNFFLPFLADARNNSTVLYNMVEKLAKETTSGRFIVWPTRTTRNTGRGAIGPGGQLSDPSSQGFASCFTETRTYQGRIKIAGELLRRGKTNGGAFFPIEPMEVEGQMDDIAVDFNRMIHNDGSGRLAEAVTTAVDATTTLTIRINQSIEGAANCPSAPTMYLEIGDRIGFAIPGTDALRANAGGQNGWYVVAIPSSTTIQVATVAGGSAVNSNTILGLVAGDWIVRVSSEINTTAASSGRRREMMGIEGIFSDTGVLDGNAPVGLGTASVFNQQTGNNDYTTTTLASAGFQGNLATTAFPWNRAVVLDNGGGGTRAISEVLLQQAFSDAEERNNAQIDLLRHLQLLRRAAHARQAVQRHAGAAGWSQGSLLQRRRLGEGPLRLRRAGQGDQHGRAVDLRDGAALGEQPPRSLRVGAAEQHGRLLDGPHRLAEPRREGDPPAGRLQPRRPEPLIVTGAGHSARPPAPFPYSQAR